MGVHPSAYRKVISQVAVVLLAGYVVVKQAADAGAGLDDWGVWASVLVAIAGAVAVVWPTSPWTKLVGAFAAAVGQVVIAAVTDNAISGDEFLVIVGQIVAFAATGLTDNKATEPVRPAG